MFERAIGNFRGLLSRDQVNAEKLLPADHSGLAGRASVWGMCYLGHHHAVGLHWNLWVYVHVFRSASSASLVQPKKIPG